MDTTVQPSFRFEWHDTQAGDRAKALEELANRPKPSLGSTVTAAIEQESLTKRLWDSVGGGQQQHDPAWRLSPEWIKENAAGVPTEYLSGLIDSTSESHARSLVGKVRQELANRQLLSDAGWTGTAAQMLVSVLDPVQLAANFTPASVAAWMTRGGALKGAIKGGMVAGMTNAALEAGLMATQETRTPEEVFLAGLMGLSIGAPIGALAGRLAGTAKDAWTATTLRKAQREGNPLTDLGTSSLSRAEAPYTEVEVAALRKTRGPATDTYQRPEVVAGKDTQPLPGEAPTGPTSGPTPVTRIGLNASDSSPRLGVIEGTEPPNQHFHNLMPEGGIKPLVGESGLEGPQVVRKGQIVGGERATEPVLDGSAPAPKETPNARPDVAPKAEPEGLPEGQPTAPPVTPEPEVFSVGDVVEWKNKKGEMETGTVHGIAPNGHVLIEDPATGKVRAFAPERLESPDGDGFLGGSIGSGQVGHMEDVATRFLRIRWDAYAYFQKSGNPGFQKLGNLLLTDQVGKAVTRGADGQKVVWATHQSAEDLGQLEMRRSHGTFRQIEDDAWKAFRERNGLNPFKAGEHERPFFEDITKAIRGDATVATRNPEAADAAAKIAAENAKILQRMKDAGVEGTEEVAENVRYVARVFNWENLGHLLADKKTKPMVFKLVAEAIQKARPALSPEDAQRIAKGMVERLRKVPTERNNIGFLTDAGRARTAEMLRGSSLNDDEVDDILSWVFGHPSKQPEGDSPRLKHRTLLDENHSIKWVDEDGAEHKLSFNELLENDVRKLNALYARQTSGLIAMAKVGIRSRADLDELVEQALEWGRANGVHPDKLNKHADDVHRVARHVLGMPMYEGFGSTTEKMLRTMRNFNFVAYMAQGAFAQVAELGQVLSQKTIMAMRTNMSAFDDVMLQVAKGDRSLIKDLLRMGTIAEETALRRPLDAVGGANPNITRVDNATAKGAWYVSRVSGMASLTEFQRGILARDYTQRLLNIAVGAEKMDHGLAKRLATNGLGPEEVEEVFAALKKHALMEEGTRGKLAGIDYEAWERQNRRTFDLFRLAVTRESHRGIQEISLGAAPLWMNHSIGRILFQLRSFVMNAWVKQTLHGVGHMDPQAYMSWCFSTLFGALAYAAQTQLNFMGNQKELDKRLALEEIAKAGFQRAGFSSLIPMAVDSTLGFAIGDPFFKYGRTSQLGSNLLGGVPTVATAGKVLNTGSAVTQSFLTDDHLWTQRDFANAMGLLPNYYGIKTLTNTYQQDLPKRNYLRIE